jgi:hypothetical protein
VRVVLLRCVNADDIDVVRHVQADVERMAAIASRSE